MKQWWIAEVGEPMDTLTRTETEYRDKIQLKVSIHCAFPTLAGYSQGWK